MPRPLAGSRPLPLDAGMGRGCALFSGVALGLGRRRSDGGERSD